MTIARWAFMCKGKKRPGASRIENENGLHVWRRNEDLTATCKRCGMVLSTQEATDCFRQW